jgi:hypothetical protein
MYFVVAMLAGMGVTRAIASGVRGARPSETAAER